MWHSSTSQSGITHPNSTYRQACTRLVIDRSASTHIRGSIVKWKNRADRWTSCAEAFFYQERCGASPDDCDTMEFRPPPPPANSSGVFNPPASMIYHSVARAISSVKEPPASSGLCGRGIASALLCTPTPRNLSAPEVASRRQNFVPCRSGIHSLRDRFGGTAWSGEGQGTKGIVVKLAPPRPRGTFRTSIARARTGIRLLEIPGVQLALVLAMRTSSASQQVLKQSRSMRVLVSLSGETSGRRVHFSVSWVVHDALPIRDGCWKNVQTPYGFRRDWKDCPHGIEAAQDRVTIHSKGKDGIHRHIRKPKKWTAHARCSSSALGML